MSDKIVRTAVSATALGSPDQIAEIRNGQSKGFKHVVISTHFDSYDGALKYATEIVRISCEPILVVEFP